MRTSARFLIGIATAGLMTWVGASTAQETRQPIDAPQPYVTVNQSFLGITFGGPLENPNQPGLKIHSVLPKSPADKSGLKPGDRMLKFQQVDITHSEQLIKEIRRHKPGTVIACDVLRRGRPVSLQVTLGSRERFVQQKNEEGRKVALPERVPRLGSDSVTVWPQEPKENTAPTETRGVVQTPVTTFVEKSLTFTITSPATMKVESAYLNEKKIERQNWDGKPQELRDQIQDWPSCIKSDVTDLLEALPNQTRRKSRCHFRLAPRMNGDRPAVRIWLNYAMKDGHRRLCVVDYTFSENQPLTGEELLKSSLLTAELKHLSPKYREAVELTLQKLEVPRIESKVQQAQ